MMMHQKQLAHRDLKPNVSSFFKTNTPPISKRDNVDYSAIEYLHPVLATQQVMGQTNGLWDQ